MTFVYPTPVPDDSFYDFIPIAAADVRLGMDLLGVIVAEGVVTAVSAPPPEWQFDTSLDTPWGTPVTGAAVLPTSPATQPAHWWQRQAMWKRADRLDDGSSITVADGSRWIYDGLAGDGRMSCYRAGGTHARGERAARGQLYADPNDLTPSESVQWDWLPVLDGATVAVDDYVMSAVSRTGVIDDISSVELAAGYVRTTFSAGGTVIGQFDTVTDLAPLPGACYLYRRLIKPVLFSRSVAADGSRWLYVDGGHYYCWSPGTQYWAGTLSPRGSIGLTPLPSPAAEAPPLVREVVQTSDGLIGSEMLTTGPSTAAGDVLLIIYAVTYFFTPPAGITDPTSTAGTLTQVGTDVSDGRGSGLVRLFMVDVTADGAQTVDIPAAGSTEVMGVVLVLTGSPVVDGFAAAADATPSVTVASLPSVTPTGSADLLVGVYYNNDSTTWDLSGSGMVQRAYVGAVTAGMAVATLELEASGATAAGHPATLAVAAYPARVAAAFVRS